MSEENCKQRVTPPQEGRENATESRRPWFARVCAALGGLLIFLAIPEATYGVDGEWVAGLPHAGRVVAGVGALMAILWITEALPVPVTALLPIPLFPLLTGGAVSVEASTAPYADDLIFLFMGGFMVALGMQESGLHRRIALRTILIVGTSPPTLIGGFMVSAGLLSMWVSNTATVVMMLPIATSVLHLIKHEVPTETEPQRGENFPLCLLLGIAYAASIGGIGTLIGTPPNLLMAAFLKDEYGIEISFVRWMSVGLPLALIFLPLAWLLLTRVVYPVMLEEIPGGRALIRRELAGQGSLSRAERLVAVVFLAMASAWILRPLLIEWALPEGHRPLAGVTDAGIAVLAAVALFVLPAGRPSGGFLLSWRQAVKLPWGVLLLFGGGLSLAAAVRSTGVAEFIGRAVGALDSWPVGLLILLITTLTVFLTELTSNTATTATFLPILGAIAVGLGESPVALTVPMAVAASCAFMMPVATPPNAIVFSSGLVTIPQMCRAGFYLNLIGIGIIMAISYGVLPWALGAG